MAQQDFKIDGLNTSNVKLRSNGFYTTLTANADLASNVSLQLPGSVGTSGQVLTTDGSGNLFFSSSTADTSVYVGDTQVSNTSIILEAGNGVSLTANATSSVVTFTTNMSNVTSQTIPVDGSANSFSLIKGVANSHMVLISYNGLLQEPNQYEITGSTLNISNSKPLIADSTLEVRYFDFFDFSGGTGSPAPAPAPYAFQGTSYGYMSGGYVGNLGVTDIEKFSFTSDSNGTDIADLSIGRRLLAGTSSTTYGYVHGGFPNRPSNIEKFSFSSDSNGVSVGDLTVGLNQSTGQSSEFYGYDSGGLEPNTTAKIDKFPFSSDTNASRVGNLTNARGGLAGQSSSTHGYATGGGGSNIIEKFPFSSDTDATDVGELAATNTSGAGQSSSTHGYHITQQVMNKFSFSSDSGATDIGDTVDSRIYQAGQSSTTHGYATGGPGSTTIDKHPFSSDTNTTDVGELSRAKSQGAGHQV